MKNTLQSPDWEEMNTLGFKFFGVSDRDKTEQIMEQKEPWLKWFFAPTFLSGTIEAWYKD